MANFGLHGKREETAVIQKGEHAPDFTLESTAGSFTLSSLQGERHALIIFYPRDNTPGCNRQLSAARDAAAEYASRGVQVVAVNPGSLESHQRWAEKNQFGFPICVDEGQKVAASYGVQKPGGGIQRTVVLVNKQGVVTWVQEGLPSTEEILQAIDALAKDDPDSTRLSSS